MVLTSKDIPPTKGMSQLAEKLAENSKPQACMFIVHDVVLYMFYSKESPVCKMHPFKGQSDKIITFGILYQLNPLCSSITIFF